MASRRAAGRDAVRRHRAFPEHGGGRPRSGLEWSRDSDARMEETQLLAGTGGAGQRASRRAGGGPRRAIPAEAARPAILPSGRFPEAAPAIHCTQTVFRSLRSKCAATPRACRAARRNTRDRIHPMAGTARVQRHSQGWAVARWQGARTDPRVLRGNELHGRSTRTRAGRVEIPGTCGAHRRHALRGPRVALG